MWSLKSAVMFATISALVIQGRQADQSAPFVQDIVYIDQFQPFETVRLAQYAYSNFTRKA